MIKGYKISDFDTVFTVQEKTSVRQPGGGETVDYADKFTLHGAFKQNSTRKILDSGAFVNVTYYNLVWRWQPDKAIAISDLVVINGVQYVPVGDCTVDKIDRNRFYTQTLTLHA